jgi:homoserine dehydrogenase
MMIGIGIIGFGTVGVGTYRILKDHGALIRQRTGIDLKVVKVADIDLERDRGLSLEEGLLTGDALEVIDNEAVDIVVELIGGMEPAFSYMARAATRKKGIVTANKALLAEMGDEVAALVAEEGVDIGFEASVAGGIPVLRAIREGLVGNRITYILAILNGTSNYILTKMTEEGVAFSEALKEAQRLGYAEQDPTFDVEGIDAAHKLCILSRLAFRCAMKMSDVTIGGISRLSSVDIAFAKEFGYVIKLLAVAREREGAVEARVEPAMVPLAHPMSSVNGVYNAIYVVGDRAGPNLYFGRGAGSDATGSAVVSDIVDLARRRSASHRMPRVPLWTEDLPVRTGEDSSASYYMRFMAQDRPGVLSRVSGILANYSISISAVIQKGRQENGYVPIVMLTHQAVERDLKKAKAEIDTLPDIKGESVHIRIEEGEL